MTFQLTPKESEGAHIQCRYKMEFLAEIPKQRQMQKPKLGMKKKAEKEKKRRGRGKGREEGANKCQGIDKEVNEKKNGKI